MFGFLCSDIASYVRLSNLRPRARPRFGQYDKANLTAIVRIPDLQTTPNGVSATFPAYSATLLVVPGTVSGLKAA